MCRTLYISSRGQTYDSSFINCKGRFWNPSKTDTSQILQYQFVSTGLRAARPCRCTKPYERDTRLPAGVKLSRSDALSVTYPFRWIPKSTFTIDEAGIVSLSPGGDV